MIFKGGSSYSGNWASKPSGVKIINKSFNTINEAEYYILRHNNKCNCVDAIKVIQKKGIEEQNKRIETQRKKIRTSRTDLSNFYSQVFTKIKNSKAKTKSCKCCGTKFPIDSLGGSNCPICGKPLLTETEKNKVSKLEIKILNEETKLKTMKSKKGGQSKIIWGIWDVSHLRK